jgi:hypothetical protein
LKGSKKPKRAQKKAAQKTLKERRAEKKAASAEQIQLDRSRG